MQAPPVPFSRVQTSVAIAAVIGAGAPIVAAIGRPPAPTTLAVTTMLVESVLCLAVAATFRLPTRPSLTVARAVTLLVVGALAAVPGWFFGPNGLFAGVVVILLLLSGVLSDGPVAWASYAGLAGGQLAIMSLVLARVVPDVSLLPIAVRDVPRTDYVLATIFLQTVYLGAFLGARAFHDRYRSLAGELDEAEREAAARGALLTEARAEYMRALHIGRAAGRASLPPEAPPIQIEEGTLVDARPGVPREALLDEPATVLLPDEESTALIPDPERTPARASTPVPGITVTGESPAPLPPQLAEAGVPTSRAWSDAYRVRMRIQRVAVTVVCAVGLFGLRYADFDARVVAFAAVCIVSASVVAWAGVARRRASDTAPIWPWVVIAALAAGPGYAFGLHSAFIGLLAMMLFLGGLFQAALGRRGRRRWPILATLCAGYAVAFVAIATGVTPDAGAIPVRLAAQSASEPWLAHLFAQSILVASFVAGSLVDRRYVALSEGAHRIARQAARQEALLATTAADLARLAREAGDGLFAGHRVGELTLGKLRGRGGMGDVYEATDARGRRVAVKLIRHERAADGATHELFAREVGALARVRSPHVAEVYAAGGLDEGLPYVSMELIDGPSLSTVLKGRSSLPLAEVRDLMRDASRGLAAIHAAGMVHRDVKPQNLLRGEEGWKLIDLGVAQVLDLVAQDRWVVGTPQYMAPEQALRRDVDARADLYALCLVAYRALTGHPAYAAHDRVQLAATDRDSGPPAPTAYAALPRDVEAVLRIGLAARPEDRFASADELGAAFAAACDGALDFALRKRAAFQLVKEPWTERPRPAQVPATA